MHTVNPYVQPPVQNRSADQPTEIAKEKGSLKTGNKTAVQIRPAGTETEKRSSIISPISILFNYLHTLSTTTHTRLMCMHVGLYGCGMSEIAIDSRLG